MVPLREEHVYDFLNWGDHDDPLYTMYNFLETEATVGDWYQWKVQDERDKYFAIVEAGVAIGYMGLKCISNIRKRAEIGIILDKNKTGRGYGKAALKELLDYGFSTLGLEIIDLEVLPWNTRAKHLYRELGFQLMTRIYRSVELSKEVLELPAYEAYRDKIRIGSQFSAVLVDHMELTKGAWRREV